MPRYAVVPLAQGFAWAMLLCLLAECAHAAEAAAIEWVTAELAGRPGQRIAMLVNAQIDGKPCAMQMDTGMDSAIAWHQYPSDPGETAEVTVAFVGVTRRVAATQATRRSVAACTSGSPVGSLGNAFFDHGTLSLDLRAGRLSFAPGSVLATAADTQPMLYVRGAAAGGRPLVDVRSVMGCRGRRCWTPGLQRSAWWCLRLRIGPSGPAGPNCVPMRQGSRVFVPIPGDATTPATWPTASFPCSWARCMWPRPRSPSARK
jgi:hypothetical protein